MKRFLALGLGFAASAVAYAANPVSVHPPAVPQSGLSQSLPSAIQSAASPTSPPPTLSSTPSWNAGAAWAPSTSTIPTVGPNYLTPSPTAEPCASCASAPRPHFNLLSPPGWLNRTAGDGCANRGSRLDQFKQWIGFRPCDSEWTRTPAGYRTPVQWYTGRSNCPIGGCDIPTTCEPEGRSKDRAGFPLLRGHGLAKTPTCDVAIPTTGLPPAAGSSATGRPRVVYVPLDSRAGVVPSYGSSGGQSTCDGPACRPNLLQRLTGFLTGGHGAKGSAGSEIGYGNCPPPPPSPVHYASPCSSPPATSTYSHPVQPYSTYPVNPAATPALPPVPVTPGGVGTSVPANGSKISGRIADATRPFTNP